MKLDSIESKGYIRGYIHDWQEIIKPALDDGELEGASIVIGDKLIRHGLVGEYLVGLNPEVRARYDISISYLNGLYEKMIGRDCPQRFVEMITNSIDRLLADTDLILK